MAFIALTLLLISACKDDPASPSDDQLAAGSYCAGGGLIYTSGTCGDTDSAQTGVCFGPGEGDSQISASTQSTCEDYYTEYCNCSANQCLDDDTQEQNTEATTEADCDALGDDYNWTGNGTCNDITDAEECEAQEGAIWDAAPGEWIDLSEFVEGWCFTLSSNGTLVDSDGLTGTWSQSGSTLTTTIDAACVYHEDDSVAEEATTEEDCDAIDDTEWWPEETNTSTVTSSNTFTLTREAIYECSGAGDHDTTEEECANLSGGEWVMMQPCLGIFWD